MQNRRAGLERRPGIEDALRSTVPIALVGAMTASLALSGPAAIATPRRSPDRNADASTPNRAAAPARVAPAAAARATETPPETYAVVAGDTVSGIAERFGLSTPAVLAMNGLSWRSLIHPGQVLRLGATPAPAAPAPPAAAPQATAPLAPTTYTIQRGDTMSSIAKRHGVPTAQLLATNGLSWSSVIFPGQRISIPGGTGMRLASAVTSAPAPAPTPSAYTILRGDTVSAIAAAHGTTVDAVLAANGLTRESMIFAGRTLQLPAATTDAGTPAPAGALDPDAVANARTIIQIGRSLGVPDRGIVIALAAAAQESGLKNLPHGDRDSVGLFQQRPSAGWGTPSELMDPTHAARLFYGGPGGPGAGRTSGLLDIPGWQGMPVTQAAQAVQRSAYPDRYAQWEGPAGAWLAQLG